MALLSLGALRCNGASPANDAGNDSSPTSDAAADATDASEAADGTADVGSALDATRDATSRDGSTSNDGGSSDGGFALDAYDAVGPFEAGSYEAGDACVPLMSISPKPRCAGLMDRNGPPSAAASYPFMDSTVVFVRWADLEPNYSGDWSGSGWTTIQNALQNWHVRLRISAGRDAPDWVKLLGGPPRSLQPTTSGVPTVTCTAGVGVFDPAGSGTPGCIPYFWTETVQHEYDQLMTEVARRFDTNDNLAEVVDGLCMTVYDEVFYRQHCQPDSTANMVAAGFDSALDLACQQQAVLIHKAHFQRTRLSLAVNGWDIIMSDGTCTTSFTPASQFAEWAQCQLGDFLSVQHNHLSATDGCNSTTFGNAADSCYISMWSGPRGFQTQTWGTLGGTAQDLENTLANAVSLEANFVELPSMWQMLPTSTLQTYDSMLRATPHP